MATETSPPTAKHPDEKKDRVLFADPGALLVERIGLKKQISSWKLFTFVFALATLAAVFREDIETLAHNTGDGYIARVHAEGIIMEDGERDRMLKELAEDKQAKAVIVQINSPGGTVVGGEDWFHSLRAIAKNKPVVAVVGGMGASGGYMTAVGADRIFVHKGSIVGSVGVIYQLVNVRELAEKWGIKIMSYESGLLKGQPSPISKVPPEADVMVNQMIERVRKMFMGMVKERRPITPQTEAYISDGRILTGEEAVSMKMADAIGGEQDALDWLEKEKKIDKDLKIEDKVIEVQKTGLLSSATSFLPKSWQSLMEEGISGSRLQGMLALYSY